MTETRKLAAILAADVVGYSRLATADEDRTLARLRLLGHRRKLQAAIAGLQRCPAPPKTAAADNQARLQESSVIAGQAAPRAFREEYNESESTLVRTNSPLRRAPSGDPNPCHGATRLRSRRLR